MKRVRIIGCGAGNPALLTGEAQAAIKEAELIVGSHRLMVDFSSLYRGEARSSINPQEIAGIIEKSEYRNICVLMSGDTGFYSGAKQLTALLGREQVELLPGISSVQLLAARLGRSWQGMRLVSAHGTDCNAVAEVMNHAETFFLTGGGETPTTLCGQLCKAGIHGLTVTVGERLSLPEERILSGPPEQFAESEFDSLTVLLVDNPGYDSALPVTPGLPDSAFARGKVPMTKREVRAVALSMLEVQRGDILWDVGAGTGSVSVELAQLACRGAVYAVERNPEAWPLLEENRERHGVYNLDLIQGDAPGILRALPAPDAVFIGGSGGELPEILRLIKEKNPTVRVVITAVTVETLSLGLAELEQQGFGDIELVQLAVSRGESVGAYHMMKAQNPVWILSGRGAAND